GPELDRRLRVAGRAEPVGHRPTAAGKTQLVIPRFRGAAQTQQRQRRHLWLVVPGAVAQHRAVRHFHAGTGAADARRLQLQAGGAQPVILLPADLLDGVGPGQGERIGGHFGPHHPGQSQAQADHGVTGWTRRTRHQCWPTTRAPRAKPSWSLTGTASTSDTPAANASRRSHQASGRLMKPTTAKLHRATAATALPNMYSEASRLSPCSISAGS